MGRVLVADIPVKALRGLGREGGDVTAAGSTWQLPTHVDQRGSSAKVRRQSSWSRLMTVSAPREITSGHFLMLVGQINLS